MDETQTHLYIHLNSWCNSHLQWHI